MRHPMLSQEVAVTPLNLVSERHIIDVHHRTFAFELYLDQHMLVAPPLGDATSRLHEFVCRDPLS